MKVIILFTIILAANVASFRNAKNHKQSRIFDGDKVGNITLFPYMCGITLIDIFNKLFYCGCAIISPKYVLSAAHCFDDLDFISKIYFSAGSTRLNPAKYDIKKRNIFIHYEYDEDNPTRHYDIALIKFRHLSLSATMKPIKLSSKKSQCEYQNRDFFILGWGQVREDGPTSQDLLFRMVRPASATECRSYFNNYDDEREMCSLPGSSGCIGDSGGPFIKPAENEDILCGVILSGKAGCLHDAPSIYTRASFHHRWICDKTRNNPYSCKRKYKVKKNYRNVLRIVGNGTKLN